mgnify:CR=1 FL=1
MVRVILDDSAALVSNGDVNGTWRQVLPQTAGGGSAHTITISNATTTIRLVDVLFGEVYLCGGQSNMAFSVSGMTNASAEAARADSYSGVTGVRLFTVGQNRTDIRAPVPLEFFPSVEEGWQAASQASIARGGEFGFFSAVCWEMGRTIHDGLGGGIPVGLISSNWPGTAVQEWTPDSSYRTCCSLFPSGCTLGTQGSLYNEMIAPLAVGPMALAGAAWYQGESNTVPTNPALPFNAGSRFYACCFPAMITAWRKSFADPELYFSFVQLSTWCNPDQSGIAPMRGQLGVPQDEAGQMSAMTLPYVAYVTNADHGNGCGIHPPDKQFPGMRLGRAALNLVYGQTAIIWNSPTYKSAFVAPVDRSTGELSVTIALNDVGRDGLHLIYPYNQGKLDRSHTTCASLEKPSLNETATCGWAAIQVSDVWHNASITLTADGTAIELSVALEEWKRGDVEVVATATRYGYAPIPMMSVYDLSSDLPLLSWNRSVTI